MVVKILKLICKKERYMHCAKFRLFEKKRNSCNHFACLVRMEGNAKSRGGPICQEMVYIHCMSDHDLLSLFVADKFSC